MGSLEEMGKFLETYNLPRPNHHEMENLNRLITRKETESVIKKPFNKQKSMIRQLYWWILPNIQTRINTNASQALPYWMTFIPLS